MARRAGYSSDELGWVGVVVCKRAGRGVVGSISDGDFIELLLSMELLWG